MGLHFFRTFNKRDAALKLSLRLESKRERIFDPIFYVWYLNGCQFPAMTCTLRLMMLFCELRANERRLTISNHRTQKKCVCAIAHAHTPKRSWSHRIKLSHTINLNCQKKVKMLRTLRFIYCYASIYAICCFFSLSFSLYSSASHVCQTICGNSVTIIPLPRLIICSNTAFKSGYHINCDHFAAINSMSLHLVGSIYTLMVWHGWKLFLLICTFSSSTY